jgi:acyl-CoA thioester hydrolase
MEMKTYQHKVQYYETDQMQIVHHSNYIRWFEEARTDYLEQAGFGYDRFEREGIISPVLEVQAKYLTMTRFGETVNIQVKMVNFTGLKFSIEYIISDSVTGELRVTGQSEHCLLDRENKPIRLKKVNPELYELLNVLVETE